MMMGRSVPSEVRNNSSANPTGFFMRAQFGPRSMTFRPTGRRIHRPAGRQTDSHSVRNNVQRRSGCERAGGGRR
jgi:hypothetical protein